MKVSKIISIWFLITALLFAQNIMAADCDDVDQDGICDEIDNCKNDYNPDQKDLDNDGLGDVCDGDTDGDGKKNDLDNCPDISNSDQKDQDADGKGDKCDICPLNADDICPPCTDDEGYAQYFIIGKSMDQCLSSSKLNEIVCEGNLPVPYEVMCTMEFNQAAKCENGKCIKLPDQDKDMITDSDDNCPNNYNPNQEDTDNDGIGDVCDPESGVVVIPGDEGDCDPMPDDPELAALCGWSEKDDDGDGQKNKEDPCPNDPDNIMPDCLEIEEIWGNWQKKYSSSCDEDNTEEIIYSVSTMNFYAMTGHGYNQWFAGEGGNIFKRYGFEDWEKMGSPWNIPVMENKIISDNGRHITDLWSSGENQVVAVTSSGYVFIHDGNAWKQWGKKAWDDGSGFGLPLYAVHGTSLQDVWVAGDNGNIFHFDGSQWKAFPVYDSGEKVVTKWRDIYAVPGGCVWVVGDNGRIAYKEADANSWVIPNIALSQIRVQDIAFKAVFANRDGAWIGGSKGLFVHGKDILTKLKSFDSESTLLAVSGRFYGDALEIAVVGNRSIFYLYKNGEWNKVEVPFPNTLTAVWFYENLISAVGINGTIYQASGTEASAEFVSTKELNHPEWVDTRWAVLQGSPLDFWVAGDDLSIAHFEFEGEKKKELFYSDDLYVPFSKELKRDFRDLYLTNEKLYVVGGVDHLLIGIINNILDSTDEETEEKWQKVKFSAGVKNKWLGVESMTPTMPRLKSISFFKKFVEPVSVNADICSVRKGLDGAILIAGNLGVFSYRDDQMKKIFSFTGKSIPAMANLVGNKRAVTDGEKVYVEESKSDWVPISLSVDLIPEDMTSLESDLFVTGFKSDSTSSQSFANLFFKPILSGYKQLPVIGKKDVPHLYKITDMEKYEITPHPEKNLHRLKPASFKIDLPWPAKDKKFSGLLVMGEGGYIRIYVSALRSASG